MGEETAKTLYVDAYFTAENCGEEWGVTKFATLGDAIASANEAGVDTVIELQSDVVNETVQDYATTVALTINGNEFKMKNVHLNPQADLVLDKIAFEGDSTVNAATACKSLTITNCSANVTPSREGNHPAFVNIGQHEGNETTALSLTMTGNNILVNNESAGYGKAVFGWRYLNSVTISGNTFGSKTAPVEQRAVKLMNFTDGAEVVIEGNTIYGTDAEREFVAIDLYQNNSRNFNYIAEISGNTVVNVNKAAGNGFFFAFVESNCFREDLFGNGSVQIMADNTLNSKAVAVGNVKVNSNEREYDYIGVGVTKDENGKITGGTFIIGADGKADLMEDVALGLIPVDSDADGFWTLQSADRSTLYVDANAKTDYEAGKILGFNLFTTSKDAMAAAMELGGATINVDGLGAESSFIELNKAGNYIVTGGKGKDSLLVRMDVKGDNVNLTFNDAYFRTSWCYRVSASNTFTVTNSVIGSAAHGGSGSGWFTAMRTPTRIENSIVGIKMEKFTDLTDAQIKAMPRSAEDVKAAVEAKTYTYLPYGDNHSGPHIGTCGEFTVKDSTVMSGWISVCDRAIMSLDNSVLYLGASMGIGEARVDGVGDSNLNGWDCQVYNWGSSAKDFRVGKAAQVDITNSIVRNIGWGNGNPTASYIQVGGYVGEKGYAGILNITNSDVDLTGRKKTDGTEVEVVSTSRLEVRDNGVATITGSTVTIETVKNEGTFTVSGSTLDVGALTNSGTITVKGEASIDIDKFDGKDNNAIRFENVTIVKDSQISGNFGRVFSYENFTIKEGVSFSLKQININGEALVKGGAIFTAPTTIVDNYLKIEDKATLNVKYFNVYGTADVDGVINVTNDSRSNYSALVQKGGTVNVGSTGSIVIDTYNGEVKSGGTLNVNGGSLRVTKNSDGRAGKFKNSGSFNVTGGTVSIAILENESNMTISKDATITVTDSIVNNGMINICVDGLTAGVATVIDAKDGTADFGNVQFVDAKGNVVESGYGYHIDDVKGDLILYKAAGETIYVNAEWTGKSFGEAITYGDKTLYYGIDACDNAAVATANMTEKTTALVFTTGNVDDSYGAVRTTQSVVLSTVGDGYAYVDRIFNGKGDVTIAAGSKFLVVENNGSMTGANNSGGQFIINGELKIEDSNGFYFWGKNSTPGQLIVNKGGLLTSTFSTFENHGSATVYGKVVLGTEDKKGFWPKLAGVGESNNTGWAGHLLIDGQYGEGEMTVYADGINFGGGNISGNVWVEPTGGGACSASIVNGGKLIAVNAYNFSNGSNCTLTISNKGLLDIQGERVADPVYFQNLGSIVVSDQAEFKAENHSLTNAGTISIANATFTAATITNNGTITISGTSTINATITGNVASVAKGAALTLVDSALVAGLESYTMMLDVDKITDIKSINGIAIAGNATIGYFFTIKDTIYAVEDEDAKGLTFTAYTSEELDENGNVAIDNYNGSIDNFNSSLAVEAKAGTATLKVSKGQSVAVAEITKNDNGGVTNVSVKDNASLTVGTPDDHGSIDAIGKLSTGKGAEIRVGDAFGTNLNSTISLGKNNTAKFDNIDLKGGKNTLSIGANSDVEVNDSDNANADGYIKNVKTIKLANGTAANAKKGIQEDFTTLNVEGDIVAPAMKNSITLGNYAKLFVDGNLVNSDVNVGTTIKAGNYSEVIFGKPDGNGNITGGEVTSLAGLTIGTGSTFKAAVVGGTSGNNTISFGNNAKAKVKGDIDLLIGKDTIKTGTGADVKVSGAVKGVETITLGKAADLTAASISGVNAEIKLAAGIAANDKKGIQEDLTTLDIAGNVTGVNKVTVAKAAALDIDGILEGTAKNDTITFANDAAYSEIGSIELFEGNDKLALGNNVEFATADINFGDGNNTMTLGKNAMVNAGNIIFGNGTKDTLTLGKDAELFATGIEGVETINASKGAVMIASSVNDVYGDIKLDEVKGSWKNATIYDMDGMIDADGNFSGETYANEWDVFEFTAANDGKWTVLTEPEEGRTYGVALYDANGVAVDSDAVLTAGSKYFLAVNVETAGFNKEEDKGSFIGKITIA